MMKRNNSKERTFKTISLFCGCGGSDLGLLGGFTYLGKKYSRLPFELALSIDKDAKAVASYNANFKHPAKPMSVEDVKRSLLPDSVELLIGGFPCQSFSTVNPTKDPFDERGQLFREMARILKLARPLAFVAENVKGLRVLKGGAIFDKVLEEFRKAGYRTFHGLLNSADFGIPQKRERVFIVGVRKDLNLEFTFPKPTHNKEGSNRLPQWTPLSAVISSLVPENPKYYFSKRAVEGMKNAKNNMKRGLWQDLSQPCLTITSHLAKVSINSRDPILLVDPKTELYRRFTPREAASIQSFPESFSFVGSEADAYRQIGQAIPPVLMWHIAREVYKQILSRAGTRL